MGSVFSYFPQNRIKLKTSSLRIKAAIILSIFYRASIQRNKTTTKEEYLIKIDDFSIKTDDFVIKSNCMNLNLQVREKHIMQV